MAKNMNNAIKEKLQAFLKRRGVFLSKEELKELQERIYRVLQKGEKELPQIIDDELHSMKRAIIIPEKGDIPFSRARGPSGSTKTFSNVHVEAMRCMTASPSMARPSGQSLGFSVGGAKDIDTFRENIKEGYQPLENSITYEGIFYDYYFKTDYISEKKGLFSPAYHCSISIDPITKEKEPYLAISLSSNLKQEDFQRRPLNLVLVLDISGSMSSSFDHYYYDQRKRRRKEENRSKLDLAVEAIEGLLGHLRPEDRLGMIFFESKTHKGLDLTPLDRINLKQSKENLKRLQPMGGTNLEGGLREAEMLYQNLPENETNYDNRIIVLTDQMPNIGDVEHLDNYIGRLAKSSIYSTFIGVGVDFNSELVEKMTKVKGANYYAVHSGEEFRQRMDQEFEYMVTPLVFDLSLEMESEGFSIEEIYGSPEASKKEGEIMRVNTLFPSPTEKEASKGGIILLKLKREKTTDGQIQLKVSYKDRSQNEEMAVSNLTFEEREAPFYPDPSIRKAILLIHYARRLKEWLGKEEEKDSISIPDGLNQWERTSCPLTVDDKYKRIFMELEKHMKEEIEIIGDNTLEKELEILQILIEPRRE